MHSFNIGDNIKKKCFCYQWKLWMEVQWSHGGERGRLAGGGGGNSGSKCVAAVPKLKKNHILSNF